MEKEEMVDREIRKDGLNNEGRHPLDRNYLLQLYNLLPYLEKMGYAGSLY